MKISCMCTFKLKNIKMFRDSNLLYLVRLSLVNAVELETLGQVFLGYQLATAARSPHLTHHIRTNKAMLFVY